MTAQTLIYVPCGPLVCVVLRSVKDPPQEIQGEYVYFEESNGKCLHLPMQCYDKYVMNEEYMRVLWTGKLL
jgi:hypothetical protein